MLRFFLLFGLMATCMPVYSAETPKPDIDSICNAVQSEISGNRARDYVMRLWRYEKWSTLPGWKKAIQEAQTIMKERGFDEAVIDPRTNRNGWIDRMAQQAGVR